MNLVSKLSSTVVYPAPEHFKKAGMGELAEMLKRASDTDEKSVVAGRYRFMDFANIMSDQFNSLTADGMGAFSLRSEMKKPSPAQIKLYAEQLAYEREQKPFKKLSRKLRIELLDAARTYKTREAPVVYEAIPIIMDYASEQIIVATRPAHLFTQAVKRLGLSLSGTKNAVLPPFTAKLLFRDVLDRGVFADRRVAEIRAIKTSAWYKLNISTSSVKMARELGHVLEKIKEEAPDTEITGVTFSVPFKDDKTLLYLNLGSVGGNPRITVAIGGKSRLDTGVEVVLLTHALFEQALSAAKKELEEAGV